MKDNQFSKKRNFAMIKNGATKVTIGLSANNEDIY